MTDADGMNFSTFVLLCDQDFAPTNLVTTRQVPGVFSNGSFIARRAVRFLA
jgi:hypothetical protein